MAIDRREIGDLATDEGSIVRTLYGKPTVNKETLSLSRERVGEIYPCDIASAAH